jgi:hypothetical protein
LKIGQFIEPSRVGTAFCAHVVVGYPPPSCHATVAPPRPPPAIYLRWLLRVYSSRPSRRGGALSTQPCVAGGRRGLLATARYDSSSPLQGAYPLASGYRYAGTGRCIANSLLHPCSARKLPPLQLTRPTGIGSYWRHVRNGDYASD